MKVMKVKSNKVNVQLKYNFKNEISQELKAQLIEKVFENHKKSEMNCILAADGKVLKAHKSILAASSEYLKVNMCFHRNQFLLKFFSLQDIFSLGATENVTSYVFVPDSKYEDLVALMALIYDGKAQVTADQLARIERIARTLQIPVNLSEKIPAKKNVEQEQAKVDDVEETPVKINEVPSTCSSSGIDLPISETPRTSRIRFPASIEASSDENETTLMPQPVDPLAITKAD
jgi:BTB/POZ domain